MSAPLTSVPGAGILVRRRRPILSCRPRHALHGVMIYIEPRFGFRRTFGWNLNEAAGFLVPAEAAAVQPERDIRLK